MKAQQNKTCSLPSTKRTLSAVTRRQEHYKAPNSPVVWKHFIRPVCMHIWTVLSMLIIWWASWVHASHIVPCGRKRQIITKGVWSQHNGVASVPFPKFSSSLARGRAARVERFAHGHCLFFTYDTNVLNSIFHINSALLELSTVPFVRMILYSCLFLAAVIDFRHRHLIFLASSFSSMISLDV